jgi:hypothetical protein
MRTALLSMSLLLAAVGPAAAAGKLSEQTLILRAASLDTLVADAKFLAELAGADDQLKAAEKYLKSLTNDKGLEGVDTAKPMGLYSKLTENGFDSPVILMLPIADEKTFLAFLKKARFETDAPDKTGLYKMSLRGLPVPAFLRFVDGYAYGTLVNPENIDKDKLIAPDVILKAADVGTLSATLNLEQVPADFKTLAMGAIGRSLAALKDVKAPGEPDSVKKFRVGALDEAGDLIRSALEDGGAATVRLDVDRKVGDLGVALTFAAKEKSKLATAIADLGGVKGVGAALVPSDSAAHVVVQAMLSDNLRKLLKPAIDDVSDRLLESVKDKGDRERAEKIVKALLPTARMATLDFGLSLMSAGDHYTSLFAVRVRDGRDIEKAIRDLVKDLPEKERDRITLDFDKAGAVNVHRIRPDEDAAAKKLLGDTTTYFSLRGDALFLAVGDKALPALKEAVAREPKVSRPFEAELALARLAPLLEGEVKGATDVARKVFGDRKDSDRLTITVDAGKSLRVRAGMKTAVIQFFAQLDEARRKK